MSDKRAEAAWANAISGRTLAIEDTRAMRELEAERRGFLAGRASLAEELMSEETVERVRRAIVAADAEHEDGPWSGPLARAALKAAIEDEARRPGPSDALRAIRAEAWDEGYGPDEEANTPRENPYREGA